MKLGMITLFSFSVIALSSASAQNSTAAQSTVAPSVIATQHKVAMKQFSEKLQEEDLGVSDTGCPAGGTRNVDGAKIISATALSAEKQISQLMPLSAALAAAELAKPSVCGTCKQMVIATPYVITAPAKVSVKAFCDNRPTMTVEGDFQSEDQGEDYIQDVLKKKNADGQRLYAGCPDPCAFSVYSGKRTLANGKIRLTTTVLCGQPRNTGILFAKYNYSYGTIVQHTCKK